LLMKQEKVEGCAENRDHNKDGPHDLATPYKSLEGLIGGASVTDTPRHHAVTFSRALPDQAVASMLRTKETAAAGTRSLSGLSAEGTPHENKPFRRSEK